MNLFPRQPNTCEVLHASYREFRGLSGGTFSKIRFYYLDRIANSPLCRASLLLLLSWCSLTSSRAQSPADFGAALGYPDFDWSGSRNIAGQSQWEILFGTTGDPESNTYVASALTEPESFAELSATLIGPGVLKFSYAADYPLGMFYCGPDVGYGFTGSFSIPLPRRSFWRQATLSVPEGPQTLRFWTAGGTYWVDDVPYQGPAPKLYLDGVIWEPGVLTWPLWTAHHGLTGPNAAATADPDKDGVQNLIEFAFGSPPLTGGGSPIPQPVIANGKLEYNFTPPQKVSGLQYEAEYNWFLETGRWQAIPNTGSGESLKFVMPYLGANRGFLRLKVAVQPSD